MPNALPATSLETGTELCWIGKILEVVHGRFEHYHSSKLCVCWCFDLQWCAVESHAAWGISEWWC